VSLARGDEVAATAATTACRRLADALDMRALRQRVSALG